MLLYLPLGESCACWISACCTTVKGLGNIAPLEVANKSRWEDKVAWGWGEGGKRKGAGFMGSLERKWCLLAGVGKIPRFFRKAVESSRSG